MSPEQLRASQDVDPRTDIWSLGVILYELLTKRLPFEASTVTALVAVVLTEPLPDVRVERPDVPAELAAAVHRCLEKDRDDRFASVADLVRAIAPFGRADTDDTHVDRVARVAAGSGRSLPSASTTGSGTGSGPQLSLAPTAGASNPWDPTNRRATVPIVASSPPAGGSGPAEHGGETKPATSSARLAIHGGTSVAWGETQVDAAPPKVARPRWPLVVGTLGLLFFLASTGTGIVIYAKHASAAPAPEVAPAGSMTTLPMGRKDLPPIDSATPTTTAAAPPSSVPPTATEAPSALPSFRVPTRPRPEPRPPLAGPARPASVPATAPATGAPAATKPAGTDDLSNIGRR